MEDATTLETRQAPWWLLLLGGILTVIVGILLLTSPVRTTVALVWALGLYWVIQGIFTLIGMFMDHSAWGWKLFIGVLSILAGVIVVRHPIVSSAVIPTFLILLLGIQGLIVGIVMLVMAFKGGGWGMGILGVLSIIFGIILIANYAAPGSVLAFVWAAGILAIASGAIQIVQSIRQRNE
jgi:uncharacterized membrane protein HdeD (DUF308 family)